MSTMTVMEKMMMTALILVVFEVGLVDGDGGGVGDDDGGHDGDCGGGDGDDDADKAMATSWPCHCRVGASAPVRQLDDVGANTIAFAQA